MLVARNVGLWSALLRAGAAALLGGCLDLNGACANEQLSEVASPGGARRAIVFQRSCGATTPFSTQIAVLPIGTALPDTTGNVFVADTDHGRAPSGPVGGPGVSVRWLTADSLEIRYDPRARVFVQETHAGGAEVRYVTDSTVVR